MSAFLFPFRLQIACHHIREQQCGGGGGVMVSVTFLRTLFLCTGDGGGDDADSVMESAATIDCMLRCVGCGTRILRQLQ